MRPRAWWRRCAELRALAHRLAYAGRHGEHPDPIAGLLVLGVVVVSTVLVVGAWLVQPMVSA